MDVERVAYTRLMPIDRRRVLRRLALGVLMPGAGVALTGLAGCSRRGVRGTPVLAGATVLALGDSLTHGTGAEAATAYPVVLERLSGWKIVNAGVPGDTASQALERLPPLLDEHRPALVLVSIGGNDFLRRAGLESVRANVRRICEAATAAGAQVMLIAVPEPSLGAAAIGSLSDHPLYAELAGQLRLPLHAKGWSGVLSDAQLRSDRIHANAAGYERFARGLLESLRQSGLLAP